MPRKIYVVGHKNPDTDSIVSAMAYAELLRLRGVENVFAACQGEAWPKTRYISASQPQRPDLPFHTTLFVPALPRAARRWKAAQSTRQPRPGFAS